MVSATAGAGTTGVRNVRCRHLRRRVGILIAIHRAGTVTTAARRLRHHAGTVIVTHRASIATVIRRVGTAIAIPRDLIGTVTRPGSTVTGTTVARRRG